MGRARLWVPHPQPRPQHLPAYLLDVLGSQVQFHLNKGFPGQTKMEEQCPKSCLLSRGIDGILLCKPICVCRSQSRPDAVVREAASGPRGGWRPWQLGARVGVGAPIRIVSTTAGTALAVRGAPREPWARTLAVPRRPRHAVLSCLGAPVLTLSSVLVPLLSSPLPELQRSFTAPSVSASLRWWHSAPWGQRDNEGGS